MILEHAHRITAYKRRLNIIQPALLLPPFHTEKNDENCGLMVQRGALTRRSLQYYQKKKKTGAGQPSMRPRSNAPSNTDTLPAQGCHSSIPSAGFCPHLMTMPSSVEGAQNLLTADIPYTSKARPRPPPPTPGHPTQTSIICSADTYLFKFGVFYIYIMEENCCTWYFWGINRTERQFQACSRMLHATICQLYPCCNN